MGRGRGGEVCESKGSTLLLLLLAFTSVIVNIKTVWGSLQICPLDLGLGVQYWLVGL